MKKKWKLWLALSMLLVLVIPYNIRTSDLPAHSHAITIHGVLTPWPPKCEGNESTYIRALVYSASIRTICGEPYAAGAHTWINDEPKKHHWAMYYWLSWPPDGHRNKLVVLRGWPTSDGFYYQESIWEWEW